MTEEKPLGVFRDEKIIDEILKKLREDWNLENCQDWRPTVDGKYVKDAIRLAFQKGRESVIEIIDELSISDYLPLIVQDELKQNLNSTGGEKNGVQGK